MGVHIKSLLTTIATVIVSLLLSTPALVIMGCYYGSTGISPTVQLSLSSDILIGDLWQPMSLSARQTWSVTTEELSLHYTDLHHIR